MQVCRVWHAAQTPGCGATDANRSSGNEIAPCGLALAVWGARSSMTHLGARRPAAPFVGAHKAPAGTQVHPQPGGAVAASRRANHVMACSRDSPHISMPGARPAQNAGRCGWPKIRQALASSSCTQRIPAGLPAGMPGIGLVIEGAMQQAPQPGRHCIGRSRLLAGQLFFQVDSDTCIDELRRKRL